ASFSPGAVHHSKISSFGASGAAVAGTTTVRSTTTVWTAGAWGRPVAGVAQATTMSAISPTNAIRASARFIILLLELLGSEVVAAFLRVTPGSNEARAARSADCDSAKFYSPRAAISRAGTQSQRKRDAG